MKYELPAVKRALQFTCGNSLVCESADDARKVAFGQVQARRKVSWIIALYHLDKHLFKKYEIKNVIQIVLNITSFMVGCMLNHVEVYVVQRRHGSGYLILLHICVLFFCQRQPRSSQISSAANFFVDILSRNYFLNNFTNLYFYFYIFAYKKYLYCRVITYITTAHILGFPGVYEQKKSG